MSESGIISNLELLTSSQIMPRSIVSFFSFRGSASMIGSRSITESGVRFGSILLKKSFWGGDRNFSGPLMRFVRGDTRDHIISCKNDHGASYRRYGVLHWWCRLKINVLRDFRHRSIFDFCNNRSFSEVGVRSCEVCFAPSNRHRQPGQPCPKGAIRRHHRLGLIWKTHQLRRPW